MLQFASITKTGKLGSGPDAMLKKFQEDAGKSTEFQTNLSALRARGLNSETLKQIAEAGTVDGGRTAKAMLQMTPAQLAQVNALQAQIVKAGTDTGTLAANAMYGAGLATAQGLVDGFVSQKTQIENAIKIVAEAMKTAIRQAMGIKSPSTVMHGYGVNTAQGLNNGVRSLFSQVGATGLALAEQLTGGIAGKKVDLPTVSGGTTPSAQSDTMRGNAHGHNKVVIEHLEVNINGANWDLTKSTDRRALALALRKEIVDVLREHDKRRN